LYLDYSTAGNLITTQPTSPYYAVRIGFVIIGGSSSGSIFVSVRNVYTLGSNIISPVIFTAFSNTSTPLTLNGVSGQIAPLFNVNTLASGGTNVFQIAASGAASFSNTVTANSGFVSSTGFTSGSNSLSSTNLTVGSSTYGPTSASVAGSITPGYSSAVGTSSIYSGTGTPVFSAPSGSLYLSYSGTGGGLVYYNSSSAGTSGSTWSVFGTATNSLTINSSGSGGSSPQTFNGSSAVTISYNTVGASPLAGSTSITTVGTITTGNWNAPGTVSATNIVATSSVSAPAVTSSTSYLTDPVSAGTLCRAWVNFNGVSGASIRGSYNVSSISYTVSGQYTINFTNSLPDGNYAIAGLAQRYATGAIAQAGFMAMPASQTTTNMSASSFQVFTADQTVSVKDSYTVCLCVFR
jgi:hypothetical protein